MHQSNGETNSPENEQPRQQNLDNDDDDDDDNKSASSDRQQVGGMKRKRQPNQQPKSFYHDSTDRMMKQQKDRFTIIEAKCTSLLFPTKDKARSYFNGNPTQVLINNPRERGQLCYTFDCTFRCTP